MLSSICKDSHYILYIQVLIFFLFKFGMSLTCSIMYSLSGVMPLIASIAFHRQAITSGLRQCNEIPASVMKRCHKIVCKQINRYICKVITQNA